MTWKLKNIDVKREYEVHDVPDLRDTTEPRRLVIRPRQVTLHQKLDTNLVLWASIEGQVRVDGQPAGSKMVLAGIAHRSWRLCWPPPWLNEILAAEGLEWQAD